MVANVLQWHNSWFCSSRSEKQYVWNDFTQARPELACVGRSDHRDGNFVIHPVKDGQWKRIPFWPAFLQWGTLPAVAAWQWCLNQSYTHSYFIWRNEIRGDENIIFWSTLGLWFLSCIWAACGGHTWKCDPCHGFSFPHVGLISRDVLICMYIYYPNISLVLLLIPPLRWTTILSGLNVEHVNIQLQINKVIKFDILRTRIFTEIMTSDSE